ncbi:hypothetical protein LARI1_G002960 [Lachnellula arida]|uniref:Cyclin-like f-box protein n=1 Tax=Lachnellula arida TaxID=1316785 RepID=A0A8T9BJ65_9HELO|nr:hypothetical protein LARI1_G002960 [Lachnellula arida]
MAIIPQSWVSVVSFLVFLLFAFPADALPKKKGQASTASTATTATGATAVGGAAAAAGGITTATDGSTILDKNVTINGLSIRYKISGPTASFTAASGVTGGVATGNATGTAGLNVLLHGDGGQSFFDFPNQALQNNLMGVVVLAPNKDLFWGGGSGLDRTDGVAHAAAVNSLIQTQLSQDVAFDPGNVFFTGVSGGSLLLSGFFMPAFGATYKTGVALNCGGLTPQVDVPAIPLAITAYEKIATDAGLTAAQVGALQTVDNTPNGGGHCAFDNKDFVSGVQLMSTNFANIMGANASGEVTGIGNVLKTVVGNEQVPFTSAT